MFALWDKYVGEREGGRAGAREGGEGVSASQSVCVLGRVAIA